MKTWVLGAALLLAGAGCSRHAVFRMKNGSEITGRATGHDARFVRVDTDAGIVKVDKCELDDVFHPGVGAAVTGTVFLVEGAIFTSIAFLAPVREERRSEGLRIQLIKDEDVKDVFLVWGISNLLVGLATAGWGYPAYAESVEATGAHHVQCESVDVVTVESPREFEIGGAE